MSVSRETPMTPEKMGQLAAVSRETMDRLRIYADLLVKWQAKINLVGPATIPDLWRRHMLDSAQLAPLLPDGPLLDLGSGAGFPGLVLAILGKGPVHLVESDVRKCAFLREAARLCGASVLVHNQRIETLEAFPATAITARALAPLHELLKMSAKFITADTHCLFLKGRNSEEELTHAAKEWNMRIKRIPSMSDPSGFILHLREVHRGRD